MIHLFFLPIFYISLMYLLLGLYTTFVLISDNRKLDNANNIKTSSEPINKKSSQKDNQSISTTPTHRYNLRSRTRKGPKHRPAFGGLMEI